MNSLLLLRIWIDTASELRIWLWIMSFGHTEVCRYIDLVFIQLIRDWQSVSATSSYAVSWLESSGYCYLLPHTCLHVKPYYSLVLGISWFFCQLQCICNHLHLVSLWQSSYTCNSMIRNLTRYYCSNNGFGCNIRHFSSVKYFFVKNKVGDKVHTLACVGGAQG